MYCERGSENEDDNHRNQSNFDSNHKSFDDPRGLHKPMCELLRRMAAVAIATAVTCRFGTTEKSLNYSFAMQVSLPRRMLAHARVLLTHCCPLPHPLWQDMARQARRLTAPSS